MNYNDYLQAMKEEGLEESELVKLWLDQAIFYNKVIKGLSAYKHIESIQKKIEQYEVEKMLVIIEAVDIARQEKEIGQKFL